MRLKLAALALLMAAALIQGPVVRAGNTKCDPKSGDAPCGMKSCARMAKKKQWCSMKCHNSCCTCPAECNGHNPEPQQNPDEEFLRDVPIVVRPR